MYDSIIIEFADLTNKTIKTWIQARANFVNGWLEITTKDERCFYPAHTILKVTLLGERAD